MAIKSGVVLSSVGKALTKLLNEKAGFGEADIVSKFPMDSSQSDSGQTGKISLFLYQVQTNTSLRNQEPMWDASIGLKASPLTVDLYYLVSALSKEPDTAVSHLEAVMKAFYDNALVKPPMTPDALMDTGNEVLYITPHSLSLEDMNRLWGVFPNSPYRLSVAYLVTPVYIPSDRMTSTVPVTDKVTKVSAALPLNITLSEFKAAKVGRAFRANVTIIGGSPPIQFESTALPEGLTINANEGVVSGVPKTSGLTSVTISVKDKNGDKAEKSFSIKIAK